MKGPRPSTQAIALCAEMDCEILSQERPYRTRRLDEAMDGCFEVWSRAGSVFVASACHVLVVPWPFGMVADDAWSTLLVELQRGLKLCTEKDCDECAAVRT